jgi:hypothetical protein
MNIRPDIMTREAWLDEAVRELRPIFTAAGYELPAVVRVSVGFGLTFRGENASILGQTIATAGTADGIAQAFVSPAVADGVEVLRILVHELGHVADDCRDGHKGRFAEIMKHVGCEGPMTQALPGVELTARLVLLADRLGAYPHGAVDMAKMLSPVATPVGPDGKPVSRPRVHSGPAKQGSRMLKVSCQSEGCEAHGYTVRMARSWIDKFGTPLCPGEGGMEHNLQEG